MGRWRWITAVQAATVQLSFNGGNGAVRHNNGRSNDELIEFPSFALNPAAAILKWRPLIRKIQTLSGNIQYHSMHQCRVMPAKFRLSGEAAF